MNNYDKINVFRFEEGMEDGYLCSMCGQYTSKNKSSSYEGWNLICERCRWKIQEIVGIWDVLSRAQDVGRTRKEQEEKL